MTIPIWAAAVIFASLLGAISTFVAYVVKQLGRIATQLDVLEQKIEWLQANGKRRTP